MASVTGPLQPCSFKALQTGQQPVADQGLLFADGLQFLRLSSAPLNKLEEPKDHAAYHAQGGQELRQHHDCIRTNGHFHAQFSSLPPAFGAASRRNNGDFISTFKRPPGPECYGMISIAAVPTHDGSGN